MNISELKEVLLNNVPVDVIKFIAREHQLTYSGSNKGEVVEDLIRDAQTNDKVEILRSIASQYQFAGRTSIDWYESDEDIEFRRCEETIIEKYSTDIFVFGRVRPELDKDPKLIYVNADEEEQQILLMFAYNGPIRRILVDYEPRVDNPTYFDYVIIKFNPFTVESRASFNMSKKLINSCKDILSLDEVQLSRVEIIGDDQISILKTKLGAELQLARHQSLVGDYDWIEVLADPETGDLSQSEHYLQELATSPSKRKIFVFEFNYSFGYSEKVTLEVNTENGRFWFRSAVGEEAIRYVLQKVRETVNSEGSLIT
ncbi:hypothetical protein ACH0B5_15970 [Ureibacillus sp. 179-F W5.1 NHS]|uniref:hypothetical protein n=1 Tax=Ureibacillus sp. 179-F W5.1 NHS TaxID=3374297 RepID=UPI003879D302